MITGSEEIKIDEKTEKLDQDKNSVTPEIKTQTSQKAPPPPLPKTKEKEKVKKTEVKRERPKKGEKEKEEGKKATTEELKPRINDLKLNKNPGTDALDVISAGTVRYFDEDSTLLQGKKDAIKKCFATLCVTEGDIEIYTNGDETQLFFKNKSNKCVVPNGFAPVKNSHSTTTLETYHQVILDYLETNISHQVIDSFPFTPKFNVGTISAQAITYDESTGIYSLNLNILQQLGSVKKINAVLNQLDENGKKGIGTRINSNAGEREVYVNKEWTVLYFASDKLKSTGSLKNTDECIGSLDDKQFQEIFADIVENLTIHHIKSEAVKVGSLDWVLSSVSSAVSLTIGYAVNMRLTSIPLFQPYLGTAAVSAIAAFAVANATLEFIRLSVGKGRCPTMKDVGQAIQNSSASTLKVSGALLGQLLGTHYATLGKNTKVLEYVITAAVSGIFSGLVDTFSKLSQGSQSFMDYLKEGIKTFATFATLSAVTKGINENITKELLNIKQEDVEWAKTGITAGAALISGTINPTVDIVSAGAKFVGDKVGQCTASFFSKAPEVKTGEKAPLLGITIESFEKKPAKKLDGGLKAGTHSRSNSGDNELVGDAIYEDIDTNNKNDQGCFGFLKMK